MIRPFIVHGIPTGTAISCTNRGDNLNIFYCHYYSLLFIVLKLPRSPPSLQKPATVTFIDLSWQSLTTRPHLWPPTHCPAWRSPWLLVRWPACAQRPGRGQADSYEVAAVQVQVRKVSHLSACAWVGVFAHFHTSTPTHTEATHQHARTCTSMRTPPVFGVFFSRIKSKVLPTNEFPQYVNRNTPQIYPPLWEEPTSPAQAAWNTQIPEHLFCYLYGKYWTLFLLNRSS